MYGCSWHVRFKDVERDKCADAGHVVITAIGGFHSNTGDHSHEDQFVLVRVRAGDYKKCDNQYLKEVMVQMAIWHFVSVKA